MEPAKASDVFCSVRPAGRIGIASSVIQWIIDDGTQVKKGDLVVRLDDSSWVEQLKDQKLKVDTAHADWARSRDDLDRRQKDDEAATLLSCDIAIRSAELKLKKYKGKDVDEKELLQLKVKEAQLGLVRAKAILRNTAAIAEFAVQAKKTIVDVEQDRIREIEQQIQACRLVAPQDGLVVYYVPESARLGTGIPSVVAQGEPVREGQKLLQVCDLTRMNLAVRVPEAFIAGVQRDQKAIVRVDAFPQKTWTGRVQDIAAVAAQSDFFNSDVKVYPVKVALLTDVAGLRPGMSADVSIETGRAADVLQVPAQAIVRSGAKHYCYVKSGQEIRKAEVMPGVRNDLRVEVKSGLKQADEVLRDPLGLLRRLSPFLGPQAGADAKPGAAAPRPLQLHSVQPDTDNTASPRSWIQSYGLTVRDLRTIAGLAAVAQAVPVRRFPHEARHLDRHHESLVIGTTPALADMLPLPLAEGRFLVPDDVEQRRNVVVLGAAVADALFTGEAAVGQTIVVNRESFLVVGVLDDSDLGDGPVVLDRHGAVFMPLSTCQSRFGAGHHPQRRPAPRGGCGNQRYPRHAGEPARPAWHRRVHSRHLMGVSRAARLDDPGRSLG